MRRNLPAVAALAACALLTICLYAAAALLPGPSPMATAMHPSSQSGYALGAANVSLFLLALITVLTVEGWEGKGSIAGRPRPRAQQASRQPEGTAMNGILNASPLQIMGLWEELLDAQHGRNGYGGDTAEIYITRFMTHSSTVALDRMRSGELSDGARDDYREAARTLHALCRLFEKRRGVVIEMEEGTLDDLTGDQVFDHRVHLTVSKAPARPRETTACCYLDAHNDIFMREPHGNGYRYYPRDNFRDSSIATNHIGGKPNMELARVTAICRIAFGETTPVQEGLTPDDVYRTLEELGQR